MSNNALQIVTNVRGTTAVSPGDIVRITGNGTAGRAQANNIATLDKLFGIVQASAPLASGSSFQVVLQGACRVRLETGLSPVAGQTLYVSASSAGAATNVAPPNAAVIGTVVNTTGYSTSNPYVTAMVPARTGSFNQVGGFRVDNLRPNATGFMGYQDSELDDPDAIQGWFPMRAGRIVSIGAVFNAAVPTSGHMLMWPFANGNFTDPTMYGVIIGAGPNATNQAQRDYLTPIAFPVLDIQGVAYSTTTNFLPTGAATGAQGVDATCWLGIEFE